MTDRYAVIGNPISHSKSPLIHRMFAEQTGQDISYEAIEAPLDGFERKIRELISLGYKGFNVTVPFKQKAFQLIPDGMSTCISEDAQNAMAANTLKLLGNQINIDNTDGIGLARDLENNLAIKLKGKQLLLIGAGGASRGVLSPLRRAGAKITITNRTADKAHFLAKRFHMASCSYDELWGKQFDIVVNATSAGLTDSRIPLPDNIFATNALAYDMMYGRETPFMAFARARGARVADGLGMLVEQAAEAFFIWRGVRPDTRAVLAALRP
ncbi:MAG: shikimate dehydrogenase [Sideroxydans sp.]|nr:shikimate dehydrogenase [Sideroxydans sp.]